MNVRNRTTKYACTVVLVQFHFHWRKHHINLRTSVIFLFKACCCQLGFDFWLGISLWQFVWYILLFLFLNTTQLLIILYTCSLVRTWGMHIFALFWKLTVKSNQFLISCKWIVNLYCFCLYYKLRVLGEIEKNKMFFDMNSTLTIRELVLYSVFRCNMFYIQVLGIVILY